MPIKLAKHMSGIPGEYLVAAELTRRGYIASLTLRNTKEAFKDRERHRDAWQQLGLG